MSALVRQGNRYAGLQLSPDDPLSVLCYCGLTVGRHGVSRRCTARCPGSDVDTQVCGSKLANTVIYVYRGQRQLAASARSSTGEVSFLPRCIERMQGGLVRRKLSVRLSVCLSNAYCYETE